MIRPRAETGGRSGSADGQTGNGGLTAHPGGDRWRWESRIFAGAYDDAHAHERPVYGALNFRRSPVGAAPRFGSAHFRLTAGTLDRTTFCCPDSFLEPADFGVAARMRLIELAEADRKDALDDYIEAQVHGPVRLDLHAEALVLDPRVIGDAARSGLHDGQDLKKVWHCLARFGRTATAGRA
ncbi:DUF3626 domain-containing protein [Streptomyces sp. NPDC059499]|uniref:DUF3626 domain-containing protein n=1 Tax=Streptomyces sp. NPDC059499 TaxID=3346852 RepID=UPI003692C740